GIFGNVTASRSSTNKDGVAAASCNGAFAYVSDGVDSLGALPAGLVHFQVGNVAGTSAFSTAVFQYTVTYASALTGDPLVGWLYQNGQLAVNPGADPNADVANGPVVFIQAPQCL